MAVGSFGIEKESLKELLREASIGKAQLPDFQRGWVWPDKNIAGLIASISLGYPVGTVMMLQTGGHVKFQERPIEGLKFDGKNKAERLILDGQQRITSLYRALVHQEPVQTRDIRKKKVSGWFYIDIIAALEGIEAFRNLGKDLTKVINSEKALTKLEREKTPKSTDDKREEKENKSFKKELREKLLKFVSRVPVFMYLTDYREQTLKDVIMQLERPLFTKVTGLRIQDFEKMCEIGVFNSQAMNSAIFSFRRFELGSLYYAGGGTELEKIGLFDTTVSAIEGL